MYSGLDDSHCGNRSGRGDYLDVFADLDGAHFGDRYVQFSRLVDSDSGNGNGSSGGGTW